MDNVTCRIVHVFAVLERIRHGKDWSTRETSQETSNAQAGCERQPFCLHVQEDEYVGYSARNYIVGSAEALPLCVSDFCEY